MQNDKGPIKRLRSSLFVCVNNFCPESSKILSNKQRMVLINEYGNQEKSCCRFIIYNARHHDCGGRLHCCGFSGQAGKRFSADRRTPANRTASAERTADREYPSADQPTTPSAEPTTEAPTEPVDNEVTDVMPDKFVVPATGYVSKSFDNEMPVYSQTMNDYRIHDGIDVACDVDSEVYACAQGTIESIYEDPLMGEAITVYHGGGLRSTYLNLSGRVPANIKEGAEVAAGQVIGYVGETAMIECAEVPHLHFIMTMEEEPVDPLDYVTYEGAVSSNAVDFEG